MGVYADAPVVPAGLPFICRRRGGNAVAASCCSDFHDGDAVFPFAEGTEPVGFHRRMGAQMGMYGSPQSAGAFSVNDGDLSEPRHDRVVNEAIDFQQRLIGGLSPQIKFGPD